MAKVSTFIYCEGIRSEPTPNGPKLNLMGPLQIFTPAFIPSMFSFAVCFGILDMDLKLAHKVRFVFKNPAEKDKPVLDTNDVQIPPQNTKNLPESMQGFMFNLDFRNLPLKNEGTYEGIVYFDGIKLGEYPICVKAVEPV